MTIMKLTAASVADLQPSQQSCTYWDTQLTGFACRVSPKGKKVWNVRLRRPKGRPTTVAIAEVRKCSISEARTIARDMIRQAEEQCAMHFGMKRKSRMARQVALREHQHAELTFSDVYPRYIDRLLKKHAVEDAYERAPDTWPSDVKQKRSTYVALAKAGWADRPLSEISFRDVRALVNEKAEAGHARSANLLKSHISSLFRWAIEKELAEVNPARDVPKVAYRPKRTALTAEEAKAFLEELEDLEIVRPMQAHYMRFMLSVGTRVTEGLELRWKNDGQNNHVDMEKDLVIFRRHKTVRITGQMNIALTKDARTVLEDMQRQGLTRSPDGIIFYDRTTHSGHITPRSCATHFKGIMRRLQDRFGWPDERTNELTLYKLRHSFATEMLRRGMDLRTLMHQLKHTNQATTELYVADHERDEALKRVRCIA